MTALRHQRAVARLLQQDEAAIGLHEDLEQAVEQLAASTSSSATALPRFWAISIIARSLTSGFTRSRTPLGLEPSSMVDMIVEPAPASSSKTVTAADELARRSRPAQVSGLIVMEGKQDRRSSAGRSAQQAAALDCSPLTNVPLRLCRSST